MYNNNKQHQHKTHLYVLICGKRCSWPAGCVWNGRVMARSKQARMCRWVKQVATRKHTGRRQLVVGGNSCDVSILTAIWNQPRTLHLSFSSNLRKCYEKAVKIIMWDSAKILIGGNVKDLILQNFCTKDHFILTLCTTLELLERAHVISLWIYVNYLTSPANHRCRSSNHRLTSARCSRPVTSAAARNSSVNWCLCCS